MNNGIVPDPDDEIRIALIEELKEAVVPSVISIGGINEMLFDAIGQFRPFTGIGVSYRGIDRGLAKDGIV